MESQKSSKEEMQKMFKAADKDGSGCLSEQEVKDLLQQGNRNTTDSQFQEVFKFFNADSGDQKITLEEFQKGLEALEAFAEEIKAIFKEHDSDNSGCLDKNELKKVLLECDHTFTDAEINEILKSVDASGDGKISIEEFLNGFT